MTFCGAPLYRKELFMDQIQSTYQLGLWFNRHLFSYYRSTFKGMFGAVQVQVLSDLYLLSRVRLQTLADRLDVPKQHASKILARLGDLGFVSSSPDPADGRSRFFTLTQNGTDLVRKHIQESNAHFQKMLEKLDEADRQTLSQSLQTLLGILDKIEQDPSWTD